MQKANIQTGIHYVQEIARAIPIEDSVRVKSRSIMGTEIPLVEHEEEKRQPYYGFYNSSESVDEAREGFLKVKELTIRLSMVENSAYRLAVNIRKTQKRANALKNITIPSYTALVKNISNALEEKEREEFTRLKVIKRNMQNEKRPGGGNSSRAVSAADKSFVRFSLPGIFFISIFLRRGFAIVHLRAVAPPAISNRFISGERRP